MVTSLVVTRASSTSLTVVAYCSTASALPPFCALAPSSQAPRAFRYLSRSSCQGLCEHWHFAAGPCITRQQLAIISESHAIIIDKVEHNLLTVDNHPAWGALFNLNTYTVKALHMKSNLFCAGGSFLGNGTLINVGRNPVVETHTAPLDFSDTDGTQGVRIFQPWEADDATDCNVYEYPARVRLTIPRWYNTVVRIQDRSAMIIGGSSQGGWMNNETTVRLCPWGIPRCHDCSTWSNVWTWGVSRAFTGKGM
jgi:Glyoxal oxidase N-terminus